MTDNELFEIVKSHDPKCGCWDCTEYAARLESGIL